MSTIDDKLIFTVTQLNRASRTLVEQAFQGIWVKGELSNVATPRSGHIYFTLKDVGAEIRCALFKGSQQRLTFVPENGMAVLVRGSVSIYEPRGDYQLIITHLEKWGLGQLQQAYEALKAQLQQEGLFASEHKKPFPPYPRHIGVITSHTGAAVQDILSVLKRRYPVAPVTIYHTAVQGKSAAPEIVEALALAHRHNPPDVLILSRGGGSLEDLWCFNEEIVARAIFNSTIPIITGIGHEIDFTIADFVADKRAPTPSAAAETITPDSLALIELFAQKAQQLTHSMRRFLQYAAIKVDNLEKRLEHPSLRLQKAHQTRDHLYNKLIWLMQKKMQLWQEQFAVTGARLHSISPLATLERGYAIVSNEAQHIVRDVTMLQKGDKVTTQVARGRFVSVVEEVIAQ